MADIKKESSEKKNTGLGQRLKALRKMRNLSQETVSEKVGIMRCTYYHYESGRTVPPAKILYSLAQLYGVPPEMLLYPEGAGDGRTAQGGFGWADFSDKELELVYYFRKLDERDRKDILLFAKLKGENDI